MSSSILEVRSCDPYPVIQSADIDFLGTNVHDQMQVLISDYFVKHLSLSDADARLLHQKYYKDYGLAVSGLALHHKIDPLEFNREVDDALPLDDIITPNPQLRQLLSDINRSKVKPWLFTNAHITHAQRVVRLLGVEDMFEGLTYCDYGTVPLHPKPHAEMYQKAEVEAGVTSAQDCFFVGKYTDRSVVMGKTAGRVAFYVPANLSSLR